MGAYDQLRADVLDRLERDRLDPHQDAEAVRSLVGRAVAGYQQRAHLGQLPPLRDADEMAQRLLRSLTAYGPLTELLARTDVEEVFIEGDRVAYIDSSGRLRGLPVATTAEENRQVVDRLLADTERRLDATNPLVQARVLGGTARLTAAIPPVADHLSVTLRRHTLRRDTLASLVARDSLSGPAAELLAAAVGASASVLISGPPGAGKTSLLAALLAAVPSNRCIRVCEEIRELNVALPHGAFYESRPAALDGGAEITLRDLVRFTLAMRPEVIVVGEVRGAEAFELTRAVNAGCGFAATVHANSAREALEALVNAAIMAGENVPEPVVRSIFCQALDLVVHCDLVEQPGGSMRRAVREIHAMAPSLGEGVTTEPLFARGTLDEPLRWTGSLPPEQDRWLRRLPAGTDLRELCTAGASA